MPGRTWFSLWSPATLGDDEQTSRGAHKGVSRLSSRGRLKIGTSRASLDPRSEACATWCPQVVDVEAADRRSSRPLKRGHAPDFQAVKCRNSRGRLQTGQQVRKTSKTCPTWYTVISRTLQYSPPVGSKWQAETPGLHNGPLLRGCRRHPQIEAEKLRLQCIPVDPDFRPAVAVGYVNVVGANR